MKNYLLTLLFSTAVLGSTSAQQLGFKGGLNFTNVSTDKSLDLSTSNGFHAGFAFEFPIFSPINIGTGMYYTRRGYKSNVPGREGTVSIDYLDIPIDLMLKFGLGDLVGAYVSAGPYFSYGLTSAVFDVNGILQNGYNKDEIDLNRIDSGINIGTGVDIYGFRISAAYGFSLTDSGAEVDQETKNRVLKLSLGYFFY